MRVRTLSSFLGSLTILAIAATPGMALTTGGAAAGSSTPAAPAPATAPAIHLSPIVSKTRRLTYKGPVYEKTATGEVVPYVPSAPVPAVATATGGSPVGTTASASAIAPVPGTPQPELLVPGSIARYVNGYAAAPMNAPANVQQVIWTANQIIGLPYIYGGGHSSFTASGYDCSDTISFALHNNSLLNTPENSSEFIH